MKRLTTILILSLLIVAFLFSSCKDQGVNDNAIGIIKQSEADWEVGITWEKFLSKAAGLEGNIKWKAFAADENKSQLRAVEVNIIKNNKSAVDTLWIQWQVNTETRFSKIAYFTINGIPQSLQSGIYTLERWTMEN